MNATRINHFTPSLGVGLLLTLGLLTACNGGTTKPPASSINTADSGAGSLREALSSAASGATLKLASGTVSLASALKVSKNVTLDLGSAVLDAGGKGRVLEVPSGVNVTIKGGTLKGGVGQGITLQNVGQQATSQATYGGVIMNQGTLTLDGTTVSGGKANLGGGIANLKGATLTVKGTTNITGNTADALPTTATDDSGGGGGIYTAGTLKVESGSVSNNIARYAGGGIDAVKTGNVSISGGNVDNNKCTYPLAKDGGCAGGGIYSNGNVSISGGSISNNTATYFGGGLAVQDYVEGTGTTSKQIFPTLTITGGTLEGNKAGGLTDGAGGGLWTSANFSMTGGTVKGNSAVYGGGIQSWGSLKLTGGSAAGNTGKYGGGINAYRPANAPFFATTTFALGGNFSVKGNTASDSGGGVYVNGIPLTMTGGTVEANSAVATGGGIAFSSNTVSTISGGVVSGNRVTGTADGGGGLRLFSGTTVNLSGGEIRGNTAVKTGGGIVNGGTLTMTGGEISGNSTPDASGEGGGGVRLYAGSTFIASGGSIKNNSAYYGGGVKIDEMYQTQPASQFTLSGATISSNKAGDNVGGGIFNGGKLTITSGSVTGNSTKQKGGGVFNKKVATYTKTGGSISGNTPDDVFNQP